MRRAAGDISRATRHTRTPEPPQTSPAPPGAATRPSPPPIRPRARESGGGDDGAGGSTSEATTSPVTRSRRRSTRAVCLPARPEVIRASIPTPPRAAGSISRRNESLGVADARAEITSSPRRCTPRDARPRGQRRATVPRRRPGGAPGRPARRGARLLGGPVPSTRFVIHGFPRVIRCCGMVEPGAGCGVRSAKGPLGAHADCATDRAAHEPWILELNSPYKWNQIRLIIPFPATPIIISIPP